MHDHMDSLSNDMVCADIANLIDYAGQDHAAKTGKLRCLGYCMSGPFAFAAAAQFPDRIAASASIHGVKLITDAPDSPHLGVSKIA